MDTISFVAPHTARSCVMRIRFAKRWVEFLGSADGSYRDVATTDRNYPALSRILDGQRDAIAAAFRG